MAMMAVVGDDRQRSAAVSVPVVSVTRQLGLHRLSRTESRPVSAAIMIIKSGYNDRVYNVFSLIIVHTITREET